MYEYKLELTVIGCSLTPATSPLTNTECWPRPNGWPGGIYHVEKGFTGEGRGLEYLGMRAATTPPNLFPIPHPSKYSGRCPAITAYH